MSVCSYCSKGGDVGDLSILQGSKRSCGFAASRLLSILAVGCDVEGDEKDQVGGDYTHARESSKFFSGALSCIWHPLEVGGSEVGVRCEVDEAKVNNELDNLKTSDPFLPPDADSTCALEVVPVHNNVNHQVESNWDP